jgi:hypothetical protein
MILMKYLLIIAAIVIVLPLAGCKDSGLTPDSDIVFPAKDVSYMTSIQPFFNLRCSYYGCHDDQSRAGNLSLTSYVNLTSKPGMVIARDTLHSVLLQKINGLLPHPIEIPIMINQNQINGIKQWILEGAKYN